MSGLLTRARAFRERDPYDSDAHPGWPYPLIRHVEWDGDWVCTWWAL